MIGADRQISVYLLFGANLIPVVGALFFGWNASHALLVYWSENLIIGFFALLRMATASGPFLLKLLLMPFFIFHFGMFTLVHGIFVVLLTSGLREAAISGPQPWAALDLVMTVAPWAFVALFVSHGYSFVVHYYIGNERSATTVRQEMTRPYGRVTVMHLSILTAFFLTAATGVWFGSGHLGRVLPLLVLVGVKLVVDAKLHLNSHGYRLTDLRI